MEFLTPCRLRRLSPSKGEKRLCFGAFTPPLRGRAAEGGRGSEYVVAIRSHLHRPRLQFATLLISVLTLSGWLLTSAAQAPATGLESIRQDELRAKLTHFASPEFKGRGNGAPELDRAAEYLAAEFQRNGVTPAGDGKTFFQNFQMFTSRLGPGNELRSELGAGGRRVFRIGEDYAPHWLSPDGSAQGSLVFVGYGVSAPHLGFDEFAGVNLKGKIAVAIDRNPRITDDASPFNKLHRSDFAEIGVKARRARESGAAGLIIVQHSADSGAVGMQGLAQMLGTDYPLKDIPMGSASNPDNPPIPVIMASSAAGAELVPGIWQLQKRIEATLQPQVLEVEGVRASLNVDLERTPFKARNVLGLIEGRDPTLRRELVVVGAHYDHEGEFNGRIWPGADDNASGTVALLELAEAFSNARARPARSILLAAWAGEEKGLLGSRHYVTDPVAPLSRTIAMFQLDMIGRNEEHGANPRLGLERETSQQNENALNVIGSMFSADFRRSIEEANRRIGLVVKFRYDDTPEELLRRSDQWPFLKNRVPAVFVHTGEHPDYHQPTDTPDKINYPKLEKIVRLVYLTAERIANDAMRIRFEDR